MRLLGALIDLDADPRGVPIERAGFSRVALPAAVDNRHHAKRRVSQTDQGCVGHAFGGAVRARGDVQGYDLDVSDRAIYRGARWLENTQAKSLPDVGAFPELAIDWYETFGVVGRDRCPEDSSVTSPPGADVLEAGTLAEVEGTYRIDSFGVERREAIMSAIAARHFPVFVMVVDSSYMAHRGGLWSGPTGTRKGPHAQFMSGYDPRGAWVVNSWGDHNEPDPWGEDGTALVGWDFIVAETRSLSVVTFAPRVTL